MVEKVVGTVVGSVTIKISVAGALAVDDSAVAVVGADVEVWTTVIGSSGDKTFNGSSFGVADVKAAVVVEADVVVASVVLTDDSAIASVVVSKIFVGRISSSSTSSPNKF